MPNKEPTQPPECLYLTDEDIEILRKLLARADTILEMVTARERTSWLFATAKTWGLWIAAIVVGWNYGLEMARKALKGLLP